MVDLEKQIEEAADLKYTTLSANPPYCEIKGKAAIRGFVEGAKSDAAKAYHTKGMYTLQQVSDFIEDEYDNYLDYLLENNRCSRRGSKTYLSFADWFEQNKKK